MCCAGGRNPSCRIWEPNYHIQKPMQAGRLQVDVLPCLLGPYRWTTRLHSHTTLRKRSAPVLWRMMCRWRRSYVPWLAPGLYRYDQLDEHWLFVKDSMVDHPGFSRRKSKYTFHMCICKDKHTETTRHLDPGLEVSHVARLRTRVLLLEFGLGFLMWWIGFLTRPCVCQ